MGPLAQYCSMASLVFKGIFAKGCMNGQVGSSILGPPTAAVPGPVRSRKNSLRSAACRCHLPAWEAWCEIFVFSTQALLSTG